jgi:cytochrome c551/c552
MKPAGLIVFLLILIIPAEPQPRGDARRGGVVFRERGCLDCHSFFGAGAGSAPDLSRQPGGQYTPARLTALMWNHAPNMWHTMQKKGMEVPALSERELGDMFTYFYSARFFETAGDIARGKAVFTVKNCAVCHSADVQKAGPPISEWDEVADPVAWVRQMWNHSATMSHKMREKRLAWPRLTGQELSDLLVYFRSLPATRSRAASFGAADPQAGGRIFDQKSCSTCHVLRDTQPGKITLPNASAPLHNLADIAAAMWNHAPDMQRRSKGNVPVATFSGNEMNNLIGYLFWLGFFDEKGNAGRGGKVFNSKGCVDCHSKGPGPDLQQMLGKATPESLMSAVWRHGPKMLATMEERKRTWPQFAGSEMADLIAYLNHK